MSLPQAELEVAPGRFGMPQLPAQPQRGASLLTPQRPESGASAQPFAGRVLPQSTIEAFARQAALQATTQPVQKKKRRGAGLARALKWLVVLGLLAGGGYFYYREKMLPQEEAISYPDQWDSRVTPIVSFVEQERGLHFEHPIHIDFLAEADFVALFDTPDAGALDAEAQAMSDTATALFNAKGLAVDFDPMQGESTVSSVSTIGFYSTHDKRIYVRGDVLTPAVRTTLAHELTHALQDQNFDLRLGTDNDLELRSVAEADAMRVEEKYVASLPAEEQAASTAENTMSAEQQAVLDTVPISITETSYAPYTLGPILVATVFAARGNLGVDELLRTPPAEMLLLDPGLYGAALTDQTLPVAMPEGATELESPRRMSALEMLFILDAWLPWDMARGAIDDWSGGGYVSFKTTEGTVCFTAAAQFTVPSERMSTAVTWWAGASGSAAVPTTNGSTVSFTACDRGPSAAATPAQDVTTLGSLMFEHSFVEDSVAAAVAAGDLNPPEIRRGLAICRARKLASDPSTTPLLHLPELTPEQTQLVQQVALVGQSSCSIYRPQPA